MDTASPRRLKRSDRARQMREAQRRRRERLRQDNRRFLQIILPEDLRLRLYDMSEKSQQTLQDCVLSLIQRSLGEAMRDDKSSNPESTFPLANEGELTTSGTPHIVDVSSVNPTEDEDAASEAKPTDEPGAEVSSSEQAPSEPSLEVVDVEPPSQVDSEASEASAAGEESKPEAVTEPEPAPTGKRKKAKRPTNQMELF